MKHYHIFKCTVCTLDKDVQQFQFHLGCSVCADNNVLSVTTRCLVCVSGFTIFLANFCHRDPTDLIMVENSALPREPRHHFTGSIITQIPEQVRQAPYIVLQWLSQKARPSSGVTDRNHFHSSVWIAFPPGDWCSKLDIIFVSSLLVAYFPTLTPDWHHFSSVSLPFILSFSLHSF